MSVRIAKYVRLALSLVCVGLLTMATAQPVLATVMVTESFDSAPTTWVGSGNTTFPQSFGWTNTNRAGGVAGEVGGTFSRATLASYSTDVGLLDPSSDGLSLSGKGRFWSGNGGNSLIGWCNSTTPLDFVPDNFIGIRTDTFDAYRVLSRWAAKPLNIGSGKQLFIDHNFIDSEQNINLTVNPPVKQPGPILESDRPWDAFRIVWPSIAKDQDGYKMWYQAFDGSQWNADNAYFMFPWLYQHTPDTINSQLAASRNGVNWMRYDRALG